MSHEKLVILGIQLNATILVYSLTFLPRVVPAYFLYDYGSLVITCSIGAATRLFFSVCINIFLENLTCKISNV